MIKKIVAIGFLMQTIIESIFVISDVSSNYFFESLSIKFKHYIKKSRWDPGYFWRKKSEK
jgi:hypothetical protein